VFREKTETEMPGDWEVIPDVVEMPEEQRLRIKVSKYPDAKQAPDGNWYIPDPKRPGKYRQVI
jgi:hypothetical protein